MRITKENMAVEVPKFYNDFGYPHIMTTSHLKTPTAERQWESNLMALSWLCKLLLYEHEVCKLLSKNFIEFSQGF